MPYKNKIPPNFEAIAGRKYAEVYIYSKRDGIKKHPFLFKSTENIYILQNIGSIFLQQYFLTYMNK